MPDFPVQPVLAATKWPSNADLIQDCARLGYLNTEWVTLDPTFGKGTWWKRWRPRALIVHTHTDGFDFRDMDYPDDTFDAVAYDPPYVSVGGRTTSTIPGFNDAYGLHTTPTSPAGLQKELINPGLTEMYRVTKIGGIVLVKCQDYISSGKLWLGTHWTLSHALGLGFSVVDRLEHVSENPRPQPPGRRQVHARRNLSTLFVLRK